MNKKSKMIVGTMALGGVLLSASAFAAISGASGYDTYKQAVKNTYAVHSLAPTSEVTVQDNGTTLFTIDSVAKINKDNKSMSSSTSFDIDNKQNTVDVYRQDNRTIVKSSDSAVYNVMEGRQHKAEAEDLSLEKSRANDFENIADAFAGTLQNYITLSSSTYGTKQVALNLSENQVSPVINAVASVAIKNAEREHKGWDDENQVDTSKGMEKALEEGLKAKLPKLVNNIKISDVSVNASINKDSLLTEQTENITVTGTDASGKTHTLTVKITTDFNGLNNTTPDKVDLTGKQVKTIQHKGFHGQEDVNKTEN